MKINYQHDETLMWDSVTDIKIDRHAILNVHLDTIEYHITGASLEGGQGGQLTTLEFWT